MTKQQIDKAEIAARLIEAYPAKEFANRMVHATFSMFDSLSDPEKVWAYASLVRFISSFEEIMVVLIHLEPANPAELHECVVKALALAGDSRDCKIDVVEAVEVFHEEVVKPPNPVVIRNAFVSDWQMLPINAA